MTEAQSRLRALCERQSKGGYILDEVNYHI